MTRQRGSECGSPKTCERSASGVDFAAQTCAQPKKKSLFGRESVNVFRSCFAFQRHFVSLVSHRQPAEVGDVFAQSQFAVDVQIFLNLVIAELTADTGGAFVEFASVFVRPPRLIVADGIELTALIVEAVCDFVSDDRADCSVINRVVRREIKETAAGEFRREK